MRQLAQKIEKNHDECGQENEFRPHLGASLIGHECMRYLWLSFRWAAKKEVPGSVWRIFRRGSNEESIVINDLEGAGCIVTRRQEYVSAHEAGLGGSIDGVIDCSVFGVDNLMVLEIKTHNKKSFDDLTRKGVTLSKPLHYAQCQLYMAGTGLKQALYYAVCKDDDRLYIETIEYQPDYILQLIANVVDVLYFEYAPPKISANPTWYKCKMCDCHDLCFISKMTKEINCRTCANSLPAGEKKWKCVMLGIELDTSDQAKEHHCHAFHYDLMPWEHLTSKKPFHTTFEINGKQVINGQDGVLSRDLLEYA